MQFMKWWSWLMSKRLPDTPKNRKMLSIVYVGVTWNLFMCVILFAMNEKGLSTSAAQREALMKYHKDDTIYTVNITGLSKIEKNVIRSETEQQWLKEEEEKMNQ